MNDLELPSALLIGESVGDERVPTPDVRVRPLDDGSIAVVRSDDEYVAAELTEVLGEIGRHPEVAVTHVESVERLLERYSAPAVGRFLSLLRARTELSDGRVYASLDDGPVPRAVSAAFERERWLER
ncbi:hypothetical protein ACFQPA_02900 [Halomarina halobia]|uniref:Uncharacterized protein n=1 Tax=Halomarina halobia TaxID=3033386 RepID=A0ABD6A597_9EURY|nr:hypothetical protein [Halomarina sp. PSR21]